MQPLATSLLVLALVGCGTGRPSATTLPLAATASAPVEAAASATAPSRIDDPASRAPDAPDAGHAPVAEEPKPAPHPDGWGDACESDADCSWDDACMPERCVGAQPVAAQVQCAESRPAPGTCSCVARRCALRPSTAPEPPDEACGEKRCGLDQGAGRCTVGTALKANRHTLLEGPMCRCDASKQCLFEWVEPVPCRSDRDCWFEETPRLHPIRRPASVRGPFRPCVDGERKPACNSGVCGFSFMAFSC